MKWSYARYLAHATISAGGADNIIVENPEPFADILDILTEFYIARLAPNGSATLGTGPYRVDDFAPRQSASLALHDTANKDWPQAILVREVPSADERLRLLHEGAVDAALNLERVEGRLVMDAAFSWGQCINTMSVMSYLNCFSGMFASPDARLAVNLAVDGDYIAQEIFGGLAVPTSTIVSPFHLGMNSAFPPAYTLRPWPRARPDGQGGGRRELTLPNADLHARARSSDQPVCGGLSRKPWLCCRYRYPDGSPRICPRGWTQAHWRRRHLRTPRPTAHTAY